jgi:spore germination cell wall hydrolase CwlJ-like protein
MTASTSRGWGIKSVALSKIAVKVVSFIVVVGLVVTATTIKLNHLKGDINTQSQREGFVSAADRTRQLECMTRNIYWEAGSEPFEGKVAVAQVVLNRVETGRFGNDVCGVIYQRNTIMSKIVCQFSWVCESEARTRPIYPALYKESEEVAKKVLLENFRLPSLKTAIYYHADYIKTDWGKPQVAKIGRHIFYSERVSKS